MSGKVDSTFPSDIAENQKTLRAEAGTAPVPARRKAV
jgi:hypothetical protein